MSTYLAIFQQTNFLLFYRTVAVQCLLFYLTGLLPADEIASAVGFVILVYMKLVMVALQLDRNQRTWTKGGKRRHYFVR